MVKKNYFSIDKEKDKKEKLKKVKEITQGPTATGSDQRMEVQKMMVQRMVILNLLLARGSNRL